MQYLIISVSLLLWIWFLGCTITWRFGKVLLVEGMGVKSLEFAALVLFTCEIAVYLLWEPFGKWMLFAILSLWLIEQFFCHEYFTIFGSSENKLKGYNECFKETVKLFPVSETRLIPDLYHIVLHLLIAADLALIIVEIL